MLRELGFAGEGNDVFQGPSFREIADEEEEDEEEAEDEVEAGEAKADGA